MLTFDDIAPTWVDTSALSPLEDQILVEVFWRLLGGSPVQLDHLCASLGLSRETIEDVAAGLAVKGCLRRCEGPVVAARGLITYPSAHQLTTERGSVYTQCAVDALGIPAALRLAGTVEDRCALCNAHITATISPNRDVRVDPRTAVIAMAKGECCSEEGTPRMCQETNFFCSRAHAATWQEKHATLPGAVIGPEDAVVLGRVLWNRFARGGRLSQVVLDSACTPSAFDRCERGSHRAGHEGNVP